MSQNRIQNDYFNAYLFAARAHQNQVMPTTDKLPYIFHVAAVAAEVMLSDSFRAFSRPWLAVQCALLHDTIEDTAVTYDHVKNAFGEAVADGVQALTKDEELPKEKRMEDSLQRIKHQPIEVWAVKMADRIVNLTNTPRQWPYEKLKHYITEARLIKRYLETSSPGLTTRLNEKITSSEVLLTSGQPATLNEAKESQCLTPR
ncbi:MAG: HD domain-containing protein [Myxococcota bacterium]|nr:HD domain-containing protein [Myxococcota bacterium]